MKPAADISCGLFFYVRELLETLLRRSSCKGVDSGLKGISKSF
ncbi:hypothetical protein [Kushneria marisflavi]|nr:hypothetical protein [Kushneria marisflavi]